MISGSSPEEIKDCDSVTAVCFDERVSQNVDLVDIWTAGKPCQLCGVLYPVISKIQTLQ